MTRYQITDQFTGIKIDVDRDVYPLLVAMNRSGWIKTVSSCQGHPGSKYFSNPYIAFHCRSGKVSRLCKILNQAERKSPDDFIWFDLSIVHSDDVNGCQMDADRGWLALDLHIKTDSPSSKRKAFNLLAELFEQDSQTADTQEAQ